MRTSLTKLGSQALDIIARVTSEEKLEAETGDGMNTEQTTKEGEGSEDANELPCIVPQPLASPAASVQSKSSVSGLTAPPAKSKQFAETHKKGESLSDPIASPPPASKQLTPSTPDPQQTSSHASTSFVLPTPIKKLTDKQKEAINKLFGQDIRDQKKFTFNYVRNQCCILFWDSWRYKNLGSNRSSTT